MAATPPTPEVSANCWWHLPLELQRMVFDFIIESYEHQPKDSEHKRTLSVYTSVCRQWQDFFEPLNFKRLILHQDDIPKFNEVVQPYRRSFVEWIWLRVELPWYDCRLCDNDQWPTEILKDNILFTNAIFDLFEVLATWRKDDEVIRGSKGLTLELSAHSPSDSKHCFKELARRVNDTAWSLGPQEPISNGHGWKMGRQVRAPHLESKIRVFGNPKGLGFVKQALSGRSGTKTLPKLDVVKSFIIRRQFYRCFSVTRALRDIITSLPQLENLIYETWRGVQEGGGPSVRNIRDEEHATLLGDVLRESKALKKISLFEDYSRMNHQANGRSADLLLGKNLAKSTQHLEELYAALMVDAEDFFLTALKAERSEWKHLKYLSLSSQAFEHSRSNLLVQNAADAARKMPLLEVMELWNGGRAHASIFRYERRKDNPRIQYMTTFVDRLQLQARLKWQDVASWHTDGKLAVEISVLSAGSFTSHASVIPYLSLKEKMLNKTSLQQIQMEDELGR